MTAVVVSSADTATGDRLEVRGLTKAFYGMRVLDGVDFEVEPGELVGLIGPNGSGKTTAIDCISGVQVPDAGRVRLGERDITKRPAHDLAKLGLTRTFQSVRVFETLSVQGNLTVGALGRAPARAMYAQYLRGTGHWPEAERRAAALIERFGLSRVADAPAGAISYGQRKLVEFAAAMIVRPRVLLLDEPVAAVNPTLANVIREQIVELHAAGVTILLIEHNIELVTGICDRLVVLDYGCKIADGPPDAVVSDSAVQEAYFGR